MLSLSHIVQIGPTFSFRCKKCLVILSFLEDDVEVVRTLGIRVDRKIIYCRSIETACQLYEYYDELLEESAYHDPNGNLVPSNRIIAMFHSDSAPSVKTAVTASLADPNGIIRRVFATQSLSMGIHSLNIREVIHWGVPRTLEDYYQECGQAGRDNLGNFVVCNIRVFL